MPWANADELCRPRARAYGAPPSPPATNLNFALGLASALGRFGRIFCAFLHRRIPDALIKNAVKAAFKTPAPPLGT
ncbi:MAG: hypothetical protein EAZ24_11240 [Burkholderiales bacterium]|nr:MAG: hypothetical protein EAZ24_11240 [Burkholderiales bacterium]TAG84415.1 MAG: hypothetical protein EAZ21_00505 [Betaproteobacteria bacterium]